MSLSPCSFGGGPRDDRRRRLLAEEHCASAADGAIVAVSPAARAAAPPTHKTAHYGDAAFLAQQPDLFDLLPQRWFVLTAIFLAGLALIGGIEGLYAWLPAARGRVAAFDLAGRGNLGEWFSALVLLAASITATLIYRVRRHRMDDYHGRYRVWLWAALCWFLLATDAVTGLHDAFRQMLTSLTGTRLAGDGAVWWIVGFTLLLGTIGTRVLLDMRQCRLSTAALVLAACCYLAAVVIRLGWLAPADLVVRIMVRQCLLMTGHLLLLLAMGLHARYVLLDARGLLPQRAGKVRVKPRIKLKPEKPAPARPKVLPPSGGTASAPAAAPAAPPRQVVIEQPHSSPPPPAAAPSADHKLSKAERKALKQRLMEQRRERQSQGGAAR
jgi:hypothetical protein